MRAGYWPSFFFSTNSTILNELVQGFKVSIKNYKTKRSFSCGTSTGLARSGSPKGKTNNNYLIDDCCNLHFLALLNFALAEYDAFILQLLEALKYLHGKRIVHRDVKADNLLISRCKHSDHVTVKLADFGLARRLPEHSDVIGCDAAGAPLFLAPETILEEPIGQPVDLWSCGVILFILLAGYPPFWSSNDEKLLLSILQGNYSMPSPYWNNVSNEVKDLVQRLLVVEPGHRLTASEALKHPWMQMTPLHSSEKHTQRRNFAAVICGVRAMLKFRKMNFQASSLKRQLPESDLLG